MNEHAIESMTMRVDPLIVRAYSSLEASEPTVAPKKLGQGRREAMRQRNRWWFVLVLILSMAISGCDTSRQSSKSSPADNRHFMEMWGTYTHCSQSEDLAAMRVDVQRLSLAADAMDPAADPIPPEIEEPVLKGPTGRLSVDPAEMAAACALHAGQVAQETGRPYFAREMFQMIVTKFPQRRYGYYTAQAREGLDRLDAARSGSFHQQTVF
jgi:hypothetical protein